MSTPVTIGIDFGTSKSAIAWRNPVTGEVRLVKFGDESSIPSIVYYGKDEVLVGAEAESILDEEEESRNIVRGAKRRLATNLKYPLPGDPTPESTAALILKALLDAAAADPDLAPHLGPEKKVIKATITHPATFSDPQKDSLRRAGLEAGLQQIELRPEPLAAALAASAAIKKGLGRTVLVYDLGAGTFDLAILTKDDDGTWRPAIGPGGQPVEPIGELIGGDDFDNLIYGHAEKIAQDQFGAKLSDLPGRSPRLLRSYRNRKENLSQKDVTRVQFSDYLRQGQILKWEMTRTEFEQLIRAKVEESLVAVHRMLELSLEAGTAVDSCILIGGSSRIPLVAELLKPHAIVQTWGERDYAVVLGACEPYTPPVKTRVEVQKIDEPDGGQEFDLEELITPDNIDPSLKAHIDEIKDVLGKGKLNLPKQRRPVIVVGGKTGVGKSTTINRIFGRTVSGIGMDARGTSLPKRLLWEFGADGARKMDNASLLIVDLPGLGDPMRSLELKEFRPRYREYASIGDCFLIIVQPPRPCEASVMDALRLLISEGVKASQIVFGVNLNPKPGYYFDRATKKYASRGVFEAMSPDRQKEVELRCISPDDFDYKLNDAEKEAEKSLIKSFLHDVHACLEDEFPATFTEDQVILYDAKKGWHIFELLEVMAAQLPFAVLAHFKKETRRVADAILADYKAIKDAERAEQERARKQERDAWEKSQEATRKFEREQIEAEAKVKFDREMAAMRKQQQQEDREFERKSDDLQQQQAQLSNNIVSKGLRVLSDYTRTSSPTISNLAERAAQKVDSFVKWWKGG